MKNNLILIGLIILVCFGYSQTKTINPKINFGEELKSSRGWTLDDIIGHDKTGIYVLKKKLPSSYGYSTMQIAIEHFDNNMNLVNSQLIELKDEKGKRDFEFLIHFNEQIYLFTSKAEKKPKKINYLYYQKIDKKTLLPESTLHEIGSIDYEGHSKFWNSGDFGFRTSADKSKLMVFYYMPYEKDANEKLGFVAFDSELNQMWKKETTLPYNDKLFDIENFKIDDLGNIYVLGQLYNEKRKEKVKGEANYKYHIINYLKAGTEIKEYTVELKDNFIKDIQIEITDNSDIICAGFYSESFSNSIAGSFYLKINGETKEVIVEKHKKFELDFIKQNMSIKQQQKVDKKVAKGKNLELYKYQLDDLILREDGGVVLVGEQYFVEVITTTITNSNGTTTTRTTYHYNFNEIIAINYGPDGNIEWAQAIPKLQHTTNDGGFFSSYVLSVVDDKLYFVFNDNPENLVNSKPGDIKPFFKGKKAIICVVRLDSEGNQKREALFTAKEAGMMIRPLASEQISKYDLILFSQRGKKMRFSKVTF